MVTNEKYITNKQEFDIDKTRFFEIDGELYMEVNYKKQKELLKYNEKYNKWVEIQFVKDLETNIANKIIETLSSQYIEKRIARR